jgi:phosphoglycerol transferase MdoB-like AlkP superfamily enzyme
MRTEFAALTGLPEAATGFDRFNPYFSFARTKLPSLASQLRDAGYRTICIHPFDRTFYGRDRVLPHLGFDAFLGEEAFAGRTRAGAYVTDPEVAQVALDLVRDEGPGLFLFAITMENHGPWHAAPDPADLGLAPAFPALPDADGLRRYLKGLQSSDEMLRILTEGLQAGEGGMIAFYGDHVPSFPAAFAALGLADRRTDYLVWQAGRDGGYRRDLAAHDLRGTIVEALREPFPMARERRA